MPGKLPNGGTGGQARKGEEHMRNSESLKKGLKALGYKGTVKCIPCGYMRDTIVVNDRKVGIWDYQKETFVD